MNSVLLLGGTDVTLAVAEAVVASGAQLAAVVSVAPQFSISYSREKITNVRRADLATWCEAQGIRHIAFESYAAIPADLDGVHPDLCLVAGWYHMVPISFRERFPCGCHGFHASLLPLLRGGAPLNWAILSGMSETGVTLFELGDGVDDGLVFGQERLPIGARTTIGELVEASRSACARLTVSLLPAMLDRSLVGRPQTGVPSYALQRRPEDGRIDWTRSVAEIDALIRATGRPYPGAFTDLEGEQIRVWSAAPADGLPRVLGLPGQIARIAESGLPCVVAQDGMLVIHEATGADGECCIDKLRKSGHKRFSR